MNTSPTTSDAGAQQVVQLTLDEIVPYWRNPRRITDEAVSQVANSIRDYGYQQPIVVDTSNTIIIGHTRYAALRKLKVEGKIDCIQLTGLSQSKIKELRVLDNRAAEYTSWDFEQLMVELQELDQDLMRAYFPEAAPIEDPGPAPVGDSAGGGSDTDQVLPWDKATTEAEFVCPSCFHSWTMDVTADQVRSGTLRVMEASA
jgi:hypothetical protein